MKQQTLFTTFRALKSCPKCTKEYYDYSPDGHARLCIECRKPKQPWIPRREQARRKRPLTPRENQILDFLAAAKPNKEIAASLHLAEGTVKVFISDLLLKTGLANRTELAVKRALKEL